MTAVTVALVYPDLLGTYGDGGNARVLVQRLRWRGIDAELADRPAGRPRCRGAASSTCSAGARTRRSRWPPPSCAGRAPWPRPSTAARRCWPCAPAVQVIGARFLTEDGVRDGARARRRRDRPRPCPSGPSGSWSSTPTLPSGCPGCRATRTTPAPPSSGPASGRSGGSSPGWATAAATAPTDSSPATCSGPTCTGRRWPATRSSPTCCSAGWSGTFHRSLDRRSMPTPWTCGRSRLAVAVPSRPSGRVRGWRPQKRGT